MQREIAKDGVIRLTQLDLKKVRMAVEQQIGKRVKISFNQGRQKFSVADGVIQATYPSIFVVQLFDEENKGKKQTVSYSYQDVLTKDVRLMLCN